MVTLLEVKQEIGHKILFLHKKDENENKFKNTGLF